MSDQDLPRVKIDGERHYKVGGDAYPSVTTVTGRYEPANSQIQQWKDRVGHEKAEWIKNSKALLGTIVHHRVLNPYAIRNLPNPEVDMSYAYDGLKTDIETCLAMWDQCDFEVEDVPEIERRIVNHEHEYAGTFDMMTDGTVVDLKTSSAVRDTHKIQIAAYFVAVENDADLPQPEDAAIIKLDPTDDELEPHVKRLGEAEIRHEFDRFSDLL